MAQMIPGHGPRDHDPSSREGEMYQALAGMSDDYVVIHSYELLSIAGEEMSVHETDFVVFNKSLGILCIEAKAGWVSCELGVWKYRNGDPMRHGGPFRQAESRKFDLMDYFRSMGEERLLARCKVLHAVWFPSLPAERADALDFPPEADRAIVLTMEDLADPTESIERVFAIKLPGFETNLTERDAQRILSRVLAPSFQIVSTDYSRYEWRKISFARLLKSQQRVLDFLEDQRFAVVNGVAGSGKTLVAIERARRLASSGGRVLVLCYNAMLKDDVARRLEDEPGVDVYTIAGYAMRECGSIAYDVLADRLLGYLDGGFPYAHVVIDEGQDFAVEDVAQAGVLEVLRELVLAADGTMFLFYDKNQLVQGGVLPDLISDADCKLTLYSNCRNTRAIAECSAGGLASGARFDVMQGMAVGRRPGMFASPDVAAQAEFVDGAIEEYRSLGIEDIVVLTCRGEGKSALIGYTTGGSPTAWKSSGVPFYTCRKFKGLEADAVILVDVDESVWIPEHGPGYSAPAGLLFYVGASRARFELSIVLNADEDGCNAILESMGIGARRKPLRALAEKLSAILG